MPNVRPGIFGPDHRFRTTPLDANGANPVSVASSPGSLVLTGLTGTVSVPRTISASPSSLILTGKTGTVSVPRNINASPAALVLTGQTATVTVGHNVVATGGAFYYPAYPVRTRPQQLPEPQPITVEALPARMILRGLPAVVYTTRTLTMHSARVEVGRYITSEDIETLFLQKLITAEQAITFLKEARKDKWTGSISRLLEQSLPETA